MDLNKYRSFLSRINWQYAPHFKYQVMTESMENFVQAINRAKERWASEGVTLRLGIEADYFPGSEKELKRLLSACDWDYIIGSVHYIYGWGFDNPETIEYFHDYDLEALYHDFFEVVEKAIRSGIFQFVAHLDNLKVFNYRPLESQLLNDYKKSRKRWLKQIQQQKLMQDYIIVILCKRCVQVLLF